MENRSYVISETYHPIATFFSYALMIRFIHTEANVK